SLSPAERLAFVLHDMFAVSFDEIARIVDRSVPATRQLASRARRRVQSATAPPAETAGHTRLVQAFLSASRDGRFEDLLTLLAPDVVLGADERAVASAKAAAALGAPQFESELQGARAVAELFSGKAQAAQPVLVDGAPGAAWAPGGTVRGVFTFTITDGVITEIEVIAAPEQLSELDVVSH
ncbi:MAG: sigma factor-like helix-turn-helix DNA-binding protein, partial [Nocardioidaceae bacterium]